MNDEGAWRRADELVSEIEEERIDTPATIAAFGQPTDIERVPGSKERDQPVISTIEPPEETEAEKALREAQEERERRAAADAEAPREIARRPDKGEESMATGYPCSQCDAVLPTERGRKVHEGRVHGKKSGRKPTSARKSTRRSGRRRATAVPARGLEQRTDELAEIGDLLGRIRELSDSGRVYLLDLLERQGA